ncbi:hypothetical protein BS50DRAFT_205722 [Corynespora cassiicola Philippines]|uniref:Uncharacterized protein n=1 Tax=Corynespora cassiicola Philippines TaxID=1448308 RepID=A0A2T2N5E6_CORCC|nr:hypothetical protein BS50DRAFT_205722 [Corynespora cassiicola Philippines]
MRTCSSLSVGRCCAITRRGRARQQCGRMKWIELMVTEGEGAEGRLGVFTRHVTEHESDEMGRFGGTAAPRRGLEDLDAEAGGRTSFPPQAGVGVVWGKRRGREGGRQLEAFLAVLLDNFPLTQVDGSDGCRRTGRSGSSIWPLGGRKRSGRAGVQACRRAAAEGRWAATCEVHEGVGVSRRTPQQPRRAMRGC